MKVQSFKPGSARRGAWAAAAIMVGFSSACTPSFHRVGPPVLLASGEPAGPCEEAQWIDVVPTTSTAVETSTAAGYTTRFTSRAGGYGLYRRTPPSLVNQEPPLNLDEELPKLDDPTLLKLHMARIEEVRGRQRKANWVFFGGAVTTLIGSGMMLGSLPAQHNGADSDKSLLIAGAVVTGIGLLATLVAIPLRPSPFERNHARLRTLLFLPSEDDMDVVSRDVADHNLGVRAQCAR